jgi:holo-[acyl-carrier protein] synthase
MIHGIGIDIVQISKFKKAMDRWGERFTYRIFTADELNYSQTKSFPPESLAVRFAAKEALFKAMGRGLSWKEVEIRPLISGKPEINLTGRSAHIKEELALSQIHVSLSHHGDYAVAEVLLEK